MLQRWLCNHRNESLLIDSAPNSPNSNNYVHQGYQLTKTSSRLLPMHQNNQQPGRFVDRMPLELWLQVLDDADLVSSACLALSSKILFQLSGERILFKIFAKSENEAEQNVVRKLFIQRDAKTWFCAACGYHHEKLPRPDKMERASIFEKAHTCHRPHKTAVALLPLRNFLRSTHNLARYFRLPDWLFNSVLLGHRYSDAHGLGLRTLRCRIPIPVGHHDVKWELDVKTVAESDGRLLMRVELKWPLPSGLQATQYRQNRAWDISYVDGIDNVRWGLVPTCYHNSHNDNLLNDANRKFLWLERGLKKLGRKGVSTAILRSGWRTGIRHCAWCPSEYCIELRQQHRHAFERIGSSEKKLNKVYRKCLVISRYLDLGKVKSGQSKEWEALTRVCQNRSELPEFDITGQESVRMRFEKTCGRDVDDVPVTVGYEELSGQSGRISGPQIYPIPKERRCSS
jgi:hypothetical protein